MELLQLIIDTIRLAIETEESELMATEEGREVLNFYRQLLWIGAFFLCIFIGLVCRTILIYHLRAKEYKISYLAQAFSQMSQSVTMIRKEQNKTQKRIFTVLFSVQVISLVAVLTFFIGIAFFSDV